MELRQLSAKATDWFRDHPNPLSSLRWHLGESQYPSHNEIFANARSQSQSPLFRLPVEIRAKILANLWDEVGSSQHLILRKGRWARASCVTDHRADDGLMAQCASFTNLLRFEDKQLSDRLLSDWGNHWKCEELYRQHQESDTPGRSPGRVSSFLAILLGCRLLYIEGRESIYRKVVFIIHNVETLHRLTICRPLPIIREIRHLQLIIRLPIRLLWKKKMTPEEHATMRHWQECCRALNSLEQLLSVELWLDTDTPWWQSLLSSVPEGEANPFIFGERLSSILVVDLPVNPDKPEVWKDIANLQPSFAIHARGWPMYRPSYKASGLIFRLWEDAEPGSPQTELVTGTHIAHTRPRHFQVLRRAVGGRLFRV